MAGEGVNQDATQTSSKTGAAANVNIQLIYSAFRVPGVVLTCHDTFDKPAPQRWAFLAPPRFGDSLYRPQCSKTRIQASDNPLLQHRAPAEGDKAKHVIFIKRGRRAPESSGMMDIEKGADAAATTWAGFAKWRNFTVEDNTNTYNKVRQVIFDQARRQNVAKLEQKTLSFNQIVDIDDEAFENHVSDDLAGRFGEGTVFRTFIVVIIVANSFVIGLQTNQELASKHNALFTTFDQVFLTIFVMEILLKWYYGFGEFWKSGWNVFDFLLVSVALGASNLASGRILRILRVLRSFRSLRSITALNGLRTVVQSVIDSIPDMINIIFLLLIVMFIFAVLGVTLFYADAPTHFGDLGSAFWTLFVLLSLDGWVDIFNEMRADHPEMFSIMATYFGVYITIGGFIFANMIVAVVVTNLEHNYDIIKQKQHRKYRKLTSESAENSLNSGTNIRSLAHVAPENPVWRKQIPYEIPDFDEISSRKLRDYVLILAVIEENLKEYVTLKGQLREILTEIKAINLQARIGEEEAEQAEETTEETVESSTEDFSGDVLSMLIRHKGR